MTNDILSAETAKQLFDVIMICNVVGYSDSDYKRVLIENFERIIAQRDQQLRTSSDALAECLISIKDFLEYHGGDNKVSLLPRINHAISNYEATKAKGGV